MGRGKELLKNTGIIAIGKVSTRFMSFFLLPLYTAVLGADEYGVVDVFNTYVHLLLPIVTLMLGQGAFRYLVDCNNKKGKEEIVSTTVFTELVLLGISGVIFSFVVLIWSNPYKQYLFWSLITASILDIVLQFARGFRKINLYAMGSVISSGLQIIFNVIFLTLFHMGPEGMFMATIIGNSISAIVVFLALKLYKYIRIKEYEANSLKSMLQYSIPLIPNQLSLWLLNSSDRFIVNIFLNPSANGILAVSHKFPMAISALYNIFQISWHETSAVHYNDADKDEYFTETFHQVFRIFSALCILTISVLPFIYHWLIIGEEYERAYYTIPFYVLSVMFNVIVGFLGAVYVATKNTVEIAKTTIIVGVINVVVHIALIGFIDLYAAAVSTVISYLIVLIYRIIDTKKYVKIKYDKKLLLLALLVFLLQTIIYYNSSIYIRVLGMVISVLYAISSNKENCIFLFKNLKKYINRLKR